MDSGSKEKVENAEEIPMTEKFDEPKLIKPSSKELVRPGPDGRVLYLILCFNPP